MTLLERERSRIIPIISWHRFSGREADAQEASIRRERGYNDKEEKAANQSYNIEHIDAMSEKIAGMNLPDRLDLRGIPGQEILESQTDDLKSRDWWVIRSDSTQRS